MLFIANGKLVIQINTFLDRYMLHEKKKNYICVCVMKFTCIKKYHVHRICNQSNVIIIVDEILKCMHLLRM